VVPELLSPGAHFAFVACVESDVLPTDGALTTGSGVGSITELYGLDDTASGSGTYLPVLMGVLDVLGVLGVLGCTRVY